MKTVLKTDQEKIEFSIHMAESELLSITGIMPNASDLYPAIDALRILKEKIIAQFSLELK